MSRLQSERDRVILSFRVDDELKEAFRDEIDESMSQHFRGYMARYVESSDDEIDLSGEKQMIRRAYRVLRETVEARGSDYAIIQTDIAKTKLADEFNVPRESVRSGVLNPLQQHGYIVPMWGRIKLLSVRDTDG
jgi:hypothetical protein